MPQTEYTILETRQVCDGYDVTCQLVDGQTLVFHFTDLPQDLKSKLDELIEIRMAIENPNEPELELVILGENEP